MDKKEQIASLFAKLNNDNKWGTYFIGKYYFSISTNKKRIEYNLTKADVQLPISGQLKLQHEHFPALFHEYIHYLHELSTVVGNISLSLDISAKSVFSNWLDKDPKSGISKGFNSIDQDKYICTTISQDVILGDFYNVIGGKCLRVLSINYSKQTFFAPHENTFQKIEIDIIKIEFEEFVEGSY